MLKKVCRQLGVFKWPYKETKLIARRQGRVIAASAPIPHDLRNINAAVASASTTSLSTTFLDSSSTSSSSSSSSSSKRKSRSTSETVSGGSVNGNTAAGAKRQRVAPVRARTHVARDIARDAKSPRSACSSRSRSSSSRSYQHVAPTQIKGPEREQQLRIEHERELAQSGAWNPDDDDDQAEKSHADSCERSARDHQIGPNDPNLQHIEDQEIDGDEGKEEDEDEDEGQGNFEDDGCIAGIWQYTIKERPTESDGRRVMRPDTPPGLREATGSDNGYDQEYDHFDPEHSAMGRDQQPVHGNLSEMYGCDTRYSGTYGRLMADSFTRPHGCDMPSSAAMARASVRQVSSFPVEGSQRCGTQCFQLLSARLVTSSRMFLFCWTTRLQGGLTLLADCAQAPMHAYNGGNVLHTHLRSAATSTPLEEMLDHSSSPADCVAGTLHMGCIGTLNERFDVN